VCTVRFCCCVLCVKRLCVCIVFCVALFSVWAFFCQAEAKINPANDHFDGAKDHGELNEFPLVLA
jgi:hypothetical protein